MIINSLYVITAWITTLIATCVGLLAFFKNSKSKVNKKWMLMSISIAFWSLFLGFMFNSKDALSGLRYSRLLMLGANFIPITFYDFVLSLIGREDKKRERIILFMGCLIAVLLLFIDFTPLFIKGVTYKTLVKCYYPDAGPLFILHIIFYFALTSYAAFLMYRASKISSGQRKNQINYVFVASVVGFLGGSTTFPLWYRIQIPPLGSNFVWLYAIVITSAIIRYRLMDITVALTRTTIFIAVYTLVLGLPFAIAGWFRGWLI